MPFSPDQFLSFYINNPSLTLDTSCLTSSFLLYVLTAILFSPHHDNLAHQPSFLFIPTRCSISHICLLFSFICTISWPPSILFSYSFHIPTLLLVVPTCLPPFSPKSLFLLLISVPIIKKFPLLNYVSLSSHFKSSSSYFLIFFPFAHSLFPSYVFILPFRLLFILTLFSIPINSFLHCVFISMSLTLSIPFDYLFMEITQLFLETQMSRNKSLEETPIWD